MSLLQNGFAKSGVSEFYTKTIDQSLRLNDNDSAYLTRTPSSAGNRQTWTWSGWVKLGNTYMSLPTIFSADYGSQGFNLTTDFDTLRLYNYTTAYNLHLTSSLKIRDPSAWYHIVVAMDTTQATSSDRVKVYLNGTQITDFATEIYPSQNFETQVNATVAHNFSKYSGQASGYFDGYLAEVHLTDGTAYDADTFGELKSGIWIPKDPSVTYGTNGFYIDFANSADIGNDVSGNNNDFTANNLVAADVVFDSPSNNSAVINSAATPPAGHVTLSEGNTVAQVSTAGWETFKSTFAVKSGKWYWEVRVADDGRQFVGVCTASSDATSVDDVYTRSGLWNLYYNGDRYNDGGAADTSATYTFTTDDILMLALDADAGELYVGKNGTWFNSGDPAGGTGHVLPSTGTFPSGEYLHPTGSIYYTASRSRWNYGQDSTFTDGVTAGGNSDDNGIGDFKYTVPSGFLALCTSNLPDPAIDPAQDESPEDYMNVVLYTGNSTTGHAITGVGFQPDFVWTKIRSLTGAPTVSDVVRGANKVLYTSETNSEESSAQYLQSFDSDGFTVGSANLMNKSGDTFVAWNWKAGGTGVSNTDGTITSTVSANTTSGFSVVKYVGTQTAGDTVGHGLDSPPEMIIVKNLDYARNWIVYHKYAASDAETDHLHLNTTDALVDSSADWDDTAPTSTVFSLGNGTDTNDSSGGGADHIAYCFHSVDGFSKVGSAIGNGSADGTFVYTGFRPRWILYKRAVGGTGNWYMFDTERDTYNVAKGFLDANSSDSEDTSAARIDILSNGFKLRLSTGAWNASGNTHVYLAFAEQPFKYSNAR